MSAKISLVLSLLVSSPMNGSSVFSPPPEIVVTPQKRRPSLPGDLYHEVLFEQGGFVERSAALWPMHAAAGDDGVSLSDPFSFDVGRRVCA